ncbi:cache domain-containing protein [Paenibacillus thermotolerans]|uniref:cache domain-containing protein n=1 Tax=Paenibacillus thermotolerans TaxID=3027807 RepID=UPI002367C113|nr:MULTISPECIES: hypothetical protein [unclassified Paenibacillus]
MYEDQNIQEWLQTEKFDPLADMEVLSTITNFLSTEPFIERVYLINLQTQQVFDSQTGITPFGMFEDVKMLDKVKEQQSPFLQFFSHEVQASPHLALIVPSTPVKTNKGGYLVLLLNNQALQEHLLAYNKELGTHIVVLDENGVNVLSGR